MDTAAVMAIAGGLLSAALSMVLIVVIVYMILRARTRRDSQRLELFHDNRGYLIGQSFLNLQAARVDVD